MGILVYSLLWAMQDVYHRPQFFTACCGGFLHAVDVLLGNIAALSPAP